MESDRPPHVKAKLTEVNSYLTCPLCKGYYIDATTIVECLHSFCRSCIIQHLQQDNYCPICELMINTAKPNIKPDKTLQDIVYKLVPGLYASEMARRRRFWAERPIEAAKVACPEARGLMTERIIFSPQDAISLSIEYTSDEPTAWARSEPDPEVPLRRYLQCPAMLRVEHLKKFICNKYNVDSQLYHVDILYKRLPLPDHYTLMDIAYIYSWKRNEPMKFFFRITDIALVSERFDYFEPSSTHSTPISRCQQQPRTPKQHIIINNNNIEKKQSPVRQPAEKKDLTSDVIKSCDSEIKQTKQGKVTSDEKQKRDKKLNKDVDSDENICKTKCVKPTDEKEEISEKIGDKFKQTMFEETIKKNESLKAELYKIQNQAKTMELVKKTVNTTKLNIPKTVKKQQNNALDLSISSPALETSSPISTNLTNGNFCSKNMALENGHQIATTPTNNGTNSNGKRNILEIAHQLSKRSRIELDTLKVPNNLSPSSVTSPKCSPIASENNSPKIKDPEPISSSPPQQKIIINSNFSSGGSISIKRSPKKISVPRLPIAKVPMPKLHPPNIKNGKLLKFSNYTAKLANNSNNIKFIKSPAKSPTNLPKPENNIINGLTPNQLLEKYNITNLAQFNANLNQAQLAFQQALMVSHQLELHRMQQNSQKHWMSNPNILAHYENYVQSLKNQQNQIVGNSSKN